MRCLGRTTSFIPIALLIVADLSGPAWAQIRGSYSPGSTLTYGGTVSDPGFSYSNQLWFITASKLKGPQGNVLPIVGSVSFIYDNNTITYVPKFKLFHANLQFSFDLVDSNGGFAARDPLNNIPSQTGTAVGLTNTNFVPFDLGWQLKWADIQTGYNVSAPTGRYVPDASDNTSTGFWTNDWQIGTTLYLTKSKNTQVSIFNVYEWNTTQQGTGIRPGQDESVDYSLTQTVPLAKNGRWPLQFGPAGYGQWQTTQATGQLPAREPLLYGINAAGFTVSLTSPYKSLQIGTTALWEYHARNTFQGHNVTINAGFSF
jgi:hypothetical protein